jgi:hypothetical protein
MVWQNAFNLIFGPGQFAGITAADWFRMLRENRFDVHPRFALRFLSASVASLGNSINRWMEQAAFGRRIQEQAVSSPLFILGHWRSGTTHLHNLLSQDDRFASPTFFQVLYPHTFLTTEAIYSRLLSFFVPRTRFGIDNVELSWRAPYEDEFAIATLCQLSPYNTMTWPRRSLHYDRFLSLRDATTEEVDRWKDALAFFVKKLTWKYRRPLILKSPGHTCRIRLLLDLFPDAKFVHIRRNPFEVFQSMKKMLSAAVRFWTMQNADCLDWEERVLRQYREMYDVYFQDRSLIPSGNLHELSFEDLQADPEGQLHATYDGLRLPDFSHVKPALHEYVNSLSDYQRNRFEPLSTSDRNRITSEWRPCFDAWGYSIDGDGSFS